MAKANDCTLFFEEFELNYLTAQLSAITSNQTAKVEINPEKGQVFFSYYDSAKSLKTIKQEVPEPLSNYANITLNLKARTGNVSKVTTIAFYNEEQKQIVKYTTQMGSGKLVKKTEKQ